MRLRPLGTTGLTVSPIGLGLAALGRPGYLNLGHDRDLPPQRSEQALEVRAHDVLDAAYRAGIRYLDAARSYGLAEAFLASWLRRRGLAPGAVTVGSKWGYTYTAGWRADAEVHEVKDHSLTALRRQTAESRALLGQHLALYQVHSATPESGILDDDEVLHELAELGAQGLLIGLSVSGPHQADVVRRALALRTGGSPVFGVVQATWNLLEPSAGAALAGAHDAGLGVIVKEVLANGRLAGRQSAQSAAPPPALSQIADRRDATPDAVAIAAALAQPWADVVLSGAATIPQLASNLRAQAIDLTADEIAGLTGVQESPTDYWTRRARLPWT